MDADIDMQIDSFSDTRMRKLVALSFCALIGIPDDQVVIHINSIVSLIVNVMLDVHLHLDRFDYNYWRVDIVGADDEPDGSAVAMQRRHLFDRDPVTISELRETALSKLEAASQREEYARALNSVDPKVLKQLRSPPSPPPRYK